MRRNDMAVKRHRKRQDQEDDGVGFKSIISSQKSSTPFTKRSPSVSSPAMEKTQWRHLFAFTTARHLIILILATFFALLSGIMVPVNSYLIGMIFSKFTDFGSGQLDAAEFKIQVSKYIVYIVIIASIGWVSNTLSFTLWHIFGGLQAQYARQRVYDAMLLRPVEWFDQRKDGVKSLSTRLLS
jgi:ATP-binding cassette, subfamily B (MDR/TAP), member 1